MMKRRNLSMKPESKRTGLLCRGLLAGLFFWTGLGGSQGQTPGLTYPVPIDEEHFPDAVFREVVNSYDRNRDGSLSVEECGEVRTLNMVLKGIQNLEGIKYFYDLTSLDCASNYLKKLDLRGLTSLYSLRCQSNVLENLDLSGCANLVYLYCSDNPMVSLDVRSCLDLTYLECQDCQLTSLDVSGLTEIEFLDCQNNPLINLDASNCTRLTELNCQNGKLIDVNVDGCIALTSLYCYANQLIELDVSSCASLDWLDCHDNQLTDLNVRGCVNLVVLDCSANQLTILDVRGCTSLGSLSCYENQLTILNANDCTNLQHLDCRENQLVSFDLGNCLSLNSVDCRDNQLVVVDLKNRRELSYLYCYGNQLTMLDVSGCIDLKSLDCYDNQLTDLDVSSCTDIERLTCYENQLTNLDASGCINLGELICYENQLTNLDVSGCTNLGELTCYENQLTNLDVSSCTNLGELTCYENQLTHLNVSGCANLRELACYDNQLTNLDVSGCINLRELACYDNQLTNINVDSCNMLNSFDCSNNHLMSLDVSDCGLSYLYCSNNRLMSLDVSNCADLLKLDCSNNQLLGLDLSRNPHLCSLNMENNLRGIKSRVDVTSIQGLDVSRMSDMEGGIIEGGYLIFIDDTVVYCYDFKSSSSWIPKMGKFFLYDTMAVGRIDEAHFPDEAFRTYVSEHLDSSVNGYLDGKEATIKALDVSGLGIRNLKGIGNFADLESLDCSDNQLASLDLSLNTKLTELDATGNVLKVSLDDFNRLDFSVLPGFDPTKASDWTGARVVNPRLQFLQAEVSYAYETGYQGEAELPEVRFHLDAGNGEAEIAVSEANFPDAVFRSHVGGQIDRSSNDSLDIVERGNVRTLEVADMGIQDLRGIGYFNKLARLDCSNNELTSLDLSGNPALQILNAENNQLDITLDASNGFDLSLLPGFDLAKASGWEGGIRLGNVLTFSQQEVTYTYATGYSGSTEDESLPSVRFSLRADREPSVANESMEAKPQGKVYAKEHVIHTEGIEGEISVFTPSGILLYQGHGKEIPVRNDGLYIVRSGQQVWKVLVM